MTITLIRIAAAAGLALATISGSALARDYTAGALKIETPWSRATPGGAKVAGGFMKITNTGAQPDRLVSASTTISGVTEIHEMKMTDGVMKMRALGDGLVIAPGQTVELKPGGYHVMFIDLKAPIVKGTPFKAKLVFEKAGEIEVEFGVEAIGAPAPAGQGNSGSGHKHH